MYNGLTPQTSLHVDQINGGSYEHGVRMRATDAQGNSALSNISVDHRYDANPWSIIDADQVASLDLVYTFTNKTAADLPLNNWLVLPKWDPQLALSVDPTAFDDNGLKAAQVTGGLDMSTLTYGGVGGMDTSWDDFTADFEVTDLLEVHAGGSLTPGQSVTITVPMQLPDMATVNKWTTDFSAQATFGEVTTTAGYEYRLSSGVRFADLVTSADGSSAVPFSGAYLPTVHDAATDTYTVVPELQSSMPDAELGTNYWVNNSGTAKANEPSETTLYTGGTYRVATAPIAAAVTDQGYDVELADDAPMQSYIYRAGQNSATVVNPDGSAAASHTAPYVGLRQVIAANDAAIDTNTTFDPVTNTDLDLEVFDHEGNEVPLTSSDISIDMSGLNTMAPGNYPLTISYLPDAVSKTVTVAVEGPIEVTPVQPSINNNKIVIPTIEGIDYQVDSKTVTGEIEVALDETVTVTAVPQAGYAFPNGAINSWTFGWTGLNDQSVGVADSNSGVGIDTGGDAAGIGALLGLGMALAVVGTGALAAIEGRRRK